MWMQHYLPTPNCHIASHSMVKFSIVIGHQMNSQMNFNQPNFGQNQRQGQGQGQGQNQAPRYPNDQYGGNNRGSQSYQHQQQNHQTSDYNSNNQSALNGMLWIFALLYICQYLLTTQ